MAFSDTPPAGDPYAKPTDSAPITAAELAQFRSLLAQLGAVVAPTPHPPAVEPFAVVEQPDNVTAAVQAGWPQFPRESSNAFLGPDEVLGIVPPAVPIVTAPPVPPAPPASMAVPTDELVAFKRGVSACAYYVKQRPDLAEALLTEYGFTLADLAGLLAPRDRG